MSAQVFRRMMALLTLTSLVACVPPGPQPPLPTGPLSAIRLYNASDQTVCYVYISLTTDSTWGENLLGADTLPAGTERTFFLPPGAYNLRAEDCQHRALDERRSVEIADTYEWQIPPAGPSPAGETATVILSNQSGQTICYAYMDEIGGGDWTDRLGTDILPDGQTYTITLPSGLYDVAFEDCNHNRIATEMEVRISGLYYWTVSNEGGIPSEEVTLTLINNSGRTVCYVYFEELSMTDSGQFDRLGRDVVPDGETYQFQIPSGVYDMLAKDCNHKDLDARWGVEIRADYEWRIAPP